MSKGIVMEMNSSAIIVMTSEGKFAKIPLEQRSCQIGEEIVFTDIERKSRKPWLRLGSFIAVAAAVLLLLFNGMLGPNLTANKQIVAYVSIDINPSVEMGINENNIVLEIRGLNEDGVELIKNLKYANKTVDSLTEDLLQEAEKKYLSKGEGDIIISSTIGDNAHDNSKVDDVQLSTKLKEVAIQHIEKSHPEQKGNYQVTAFAAPKEVRKVAESKGLSAGKYTIYLNAKDNGQKTTIEDLKKESVHVIAKQAGGIDKLIQPGNLSKKKISELLKDDESGDLDRKLIKKQNDKKNEDKKNEDKKNEDKKNEVKKNEDKKNEDKKNEDKKNEDKKNDNSKDDNNKKDEQKTKDTRGNKTESEKNISDSQSYNKENRLNGKPKSGKIDAILKHESTPSPTSKPKTSSKNEKEKGEEQETSKGNNKDQGTDPIEKIHKNKSKDESND